MNQRRIRSNICVSQFMILCISIFAINCKNSLRQKDYDNIYDFDSNRWKEGSQFLRGQMVDDLIKSGILKNLPKDSIPKLLGEPSETGTNFIDYLILYGDTSKRKQYMLLYISIDTMTNNVNDYWLTD